MALEIAAAAYDAEGRMLNAVVDDTSTGAAPSQGASKPGLLRAQQQIDVPVSATSIRIAVRDANTDRVGAMEVTLPLAPESQAQAARPVPSGEPATAKPN